MEVKKEKIRNIISRYISESDDGTLFFNNSFPEYDCFSNECLPLVDYPKHISIPNTNRGTLKHSLIYKFFHEFQ